MHILFSRGRQPASPLGHCPDARRGQAWQAMPQTPIFIAASKGIVNYDPALADLAHEVGHLEVLRVLLIAVKGLFG